MQFSESRAGTLVRLNEASLAARPWLQAGYKFRPASQHDQAGHDFRSSHPYFGWVQAQVDALDFTMFSCNDDGVAMVYHAFGPDSYEAASVSAWAAIAPTCRSIADVGAFTGLFSILAHRLAPEAAVVAVEPNSAVRARLFTNMVANGCYPSVQVVPYAISDGVKTLPLHIAWGPDILDTGSSLHAPTATSVPVRTEIVTSATLDIVLDQAGMPPLDLIKIDVEGLEDVVLAGSHKTLSNHPTLFLEVQDHSKFERCLRHLDRFGYKICLIDDHALQLVRYDGDDTKAWFDRHVGQRVANFLCWARERDLDLAESGVERIRALVG